MDVQDLQNHPDLARAAERLDNPNHLIVLGWDVAARIDKFDEAALAAAQAHHGIDTEPDADQLFAWRDANNVQPGEQGYDVTHDNDNLLTTAGLSRITSLIIAGGGQAWDATHTRLGTGNSSTAALVGDTDLNAAAGSGNRQFVVADVGYPQSAAGVVTVRSTFTTGLGNYAWNEWSIDEGTTNGTTVTATMMNHKVVSLGTKTSAAAWVFTVTVTFS